MSIRQVAYELCKSVWVSSDRADIQNLLNDLNYAKEGNSVNRATFGYAARQQNAQLMGYLLVDRMQSRNDNVSPFLQNMPPLSKEESKLLASAHLQIEILNRKCIDQLIKSINACSYAVTPYSEFDYQSPDDIQMMQLYDLQVVQDFVTQFQTHPAMILAKQNHELLKSKGDENSIPPPLKLAESVFNLERIIQNSTPLSFPDQLSNLFYKHQLGTQVRTTFDFFYALMCIRSSLNNLNELLYQALMKNKLPVIDDSNIIEVNSMVKHRGGSGLSIKYQPSAKAGFGELGLVLVKSQIGDYIPGLCKIENMQFKMSQEFGDTVDVEMRRLDENLNAYPGLIKN